MNRWQGQRFAWVQDNFTTYWLKCLWKSSQFLSTRDLTCKKRHPVSPSWSKSPSIDRRHDAACNEDTWSSSFDVVLLVHSLQTADILKFCIHAVFKRPWLSSENQKSSRPQSVGRRRCTKRQKSSGKITLKFLAGGFPASTAESRFQALPEISIRRFSFLQKNCEQAWFVISKSFSEKKNSLYGNNAMWRVGKGNKDLSRKAPYVSERTYMFQKNPICWKRGPNVAHMWSILKDVLPLKLKKLHLFFWIAWHWLDQCWCDWQSNQKGAEHSQKFLTSSWLCMAQPGRVR